MVKQAEVISAVIKSLIFTLSIIPRLFSRNGERSGCTRPSFCERLCGFARLAGRRGLPMIRKLKSGEYRLYSRKKDPRTGKRRNLGTFKTREAAERHERAVQFFKRH